jgi:bifunctional non-homologous end joining protein LigD
MSQFANRRNCKRASRTWSVKTQGLEGLVAKRRDSRHEPGQRSGAWQKMRVNRGQEFVIGGHTPAAKNFDALIFDYYHGGDLLYAGRTRGGFTPAARDQLFKRFRGLESAACPFVNLPEPRSGRWGEGLAAEKMKDCRWLLPRLVGQFEFVEWTPDGHLRHARIMGVREDKDAKDVGCKSKAMAPSYREELRDGFQHSTRRNATDITP